MLDSNDALLKKFGKENLLENYGGERGDRNWSRLFGGSGEKKLNGNGEKKLLLSSSGNVNHGESSTSSGGANGESSESYVVRTSDIKIDNNSALKKKC